MPLTAAHCACYRFMIVFYVGYCYNRYSAMFGDLEL